MKNELKYYTMKKTLLIIAFISLVSFANAQWLQTTCPYSGQVSCFAVSGDTLFAGTGGSGVYSYSNNGGIWVNKGITGFDVAGVYALAIKGNNIFAGVIGTGMYGGGVYMSSNNGSSWTAVNNGLPNYSGDYSSVRAFAISGSNIFAGTMASSTTIGGVYMSSNNGSSWTAVNNGLPNNALFGYPSVYAFAISGNNIFAGSYGGSTLINSGVFLSSNNGSSWATENTGLTDTNVFALAIKGSCIFAGTFNSGVFLSSNNGSSWTAVNTGLICYDVRAFAISGNNIFAGTGGSGVYMSSNNGSNWTAVNTGLPASTWVLSLAISGDTLFAGTDGSGVWKRALSEMTGIEEINNNARNIAVYPNPVTDNLQIQTTLPIKEIEITDITGRLLYTTTAAKTINCSSFAKGVYFITLTSENGKAVKKIIKE